MTATTPTILMSCDDGHKGDATLFSRRVDFDTLMTPVYDFVSHTPQRVPLTDRYQTKVARMQGFQARPVIGGVFIKMLDDPATWKKWSTQGGTACELTLPNGRDWGTFHCSWFSVPSAGG